MGSAILPLPAWAADTAGPGDATAPAQPLQRYLRALWNVSPGVLLDAEGPYIDSRGIHLVAGAGVDAWLEQRAAAAHAAAHLVYSPPVFDGRGLKPLVRALVGLLEDARVESLAGRELPGLLRLWRSLHTATPLDGDGAEALMLRLARVLIDPAHDDPHPWVAKGRALCFLDDAQQVLALQRPEQLRQAASLLGNDLGQMRLGFNARLYRPGPAYRDDHRWMWPAGDASPATASPAPEAPPLPAPAEAPSSGRPDPQTGVHDALAPQPEPAEPGAPAEAASLHPEWDRLIGRLRPRWTRVLEQAAPLASADAPLAPRAPADAPPVTLASADAPQALVDVPPVPLPDPATHPQHAAVRAAWRAAAVRAARWRLARDGARFDLDALLRARIDQRLGHPPDARVYRRDEPRPGRGRVVVLIDASASSNAAWMDGPRSQLDVAREAAALLAGTLPGATGRMRLLAFRSDGRHAVQLWRLKGEQAPLDAAVLGRLAALQGAASTRLGAVLRHATAALARRDSGWRMVLLLSDGLAHDIDVHDPQYLAADARHAVRQAARQGIVVACLGLDAHTLQAARQVFGARRVALLDALPRLAPLLRRLAR